MTHSHTQPQILDRTAQIRALNDRLRITGTGGRIMLTTGVQALPAETLVALLVALAAYADFNPDNDPHGEHDCASLTVGAIEALWKIDYYNQSLSGHADPTDANTCRVLTLMLAAEY